MRAGVDHTVSGVMVRQVARAGILLRAKGKLQHLHAGQAMALAQRIHLRGDHAQVFGNDGQGTQGLGRRLQQGIARGRYPAPLLGGRRAGWNLPITLKTAKVVQAHQVNQRAGVADAGDPPAVVLGSVGRPAVQRVAPALAGGAEAVGRHPGNHGGAAGAVKFEQVRAGPDLGALVSNEDRDIAHDAHALCVGIGLESPPLAKKHPLTKLPKQAVARQRQPGLRQGQRFALGQWLRPLVPGLVRVLRLQRHEQSVVAQPGRLLLAKNRKILAISLTGTGIKTSRRQSQGAHAKSHHGLKIDGLLAQIGDWHQRRAIEPALPVQFGQVDQQRVASKGRTTHVR